MGKAIGALLGGAAGLSAGPLVVAALIPGVGPITAIGLLAGAFAGAREQALGGGGKSGKRHDDGLPEDEMFVYEDALRKGGVADCDGGGWSRSSALPRVAKSGGAEEVMQRANSGGLVCEEPSWNIIRLRAGSLATMRSSNRMGFESALHARSRCKEYDQVLGEMTVQIEELERQHLGGERGRTVSAGYERGRDYYQRLCDERKAA